MDLKKMVACLCVSMSLVNAVYALPVHINTYRSRQEQTAEDAQNHKKGYALAKLGVDLANAALHNDYTGYSKLVGNYKKNVPTIIGLYVYDPRNDFEEENKNAFEDFKLLLDITGTKKVELFDKNNNYTKIGQNNNSLYKSADACWLINDEKIMVPTVHFFEKDGELKIYQFFWGKETYTKKKIINAERNAKNVIKALKNGDYEAYQKAFVGSNAKKRLSARNCRELQQLIAEKKYKITLTYDCYPSFRIITFFEDPKTKKQAGIMYLFCDEQGNVVDIDTRLRATDYRQQKLTIVDNILRAKYVTGDNVAYQKTLAKFAFADAQVDFTPREYVGAKEVLLGIHFNTNKAPLVKLVDMGINMTRAEAALYKASFADGSTQDFLFVFDDSLLQPKCVYWEAYTINDKNEIGSKLWDEAEEKYKNNPDKYAWKHRVVSW